MKHMYFGISYYVVFSSFCLLLFHMFAYLLYCIEFLAVRIPSYVLRMLPMLPVYQYILIYRPVYRGCNARSYNLNTSTYKA